MNDGIRFSRSKIATLVVYDNNNGNIVHIHQHQCLSLTVDGHSVDAEAESKALDLANKFTNMPKSEMSVIFVKDDDPLLSIKYKVDLQKNCLIPTNIGQKEDTKDEV
jgi:hypothetical protein